MLSLNFIEESMLILDYIIIIIANKNKEENHLLVVFTKATCKHFENFNIFIFLDLKA